MTRVGFAGDYAAIGTVGAIAVDGFGIPTGLADLGAWGLLITTVAFVLVSIFRGWIVVKLHYDTLLKRCETAEAANAKLTENNAQLTETNSVQARTIEKQTAVGDTVVKVMGAVQQQASQISAGGTP